MKKILQIINIDGTEGSGKTTQISYLAHYFRDKGLVVKINCLDDNIESALKCTRETKEFLLENEAGLVINDGSIARMIVVDLTKGINQHDVLEKHRSILSEHEQINHVYGMANILMIMEDLETCNMRMKRESEFLNNSSYKIINPDVEKYVVQGIRNFDNNVITQNLKFHTIEVDAEDTILEVKDSIIEYLKNNFRMNIKY